MFFGMGPLEILIIGAIALVVIGPEKFPDVAKVFFKTIRDLRGYWDDVKKDVAEELKPVKEEVNQLKRIDANKYIDKLVSPEMHDDDGNVLKSGMGDFENDDDDDFMPTEAGEKLPGQMDEDEESALMNTDYPGSDHIIAANSNEDSAQATYGPPEEEGDEEDLPDDLAGTVIEDQDSVVPEPYDPESDFHQQAQSGEEGIDSGEDEFTVDEPERLE